MLAVYGIDDPLITVGAPSQGSGARRSGLASLALEECVHVAPRASRNSANSAFVTLWRSSQKAPTYTRCSGASSAPASSRPIQNAPDWMNITPSACTSGAVSITVMSAMNPTARRRVHALWRCMHAL